MKLAAHTAPRASVVVLVIFSVGPVRESRNGVIIVAAAALLHGALLRPCGVFATHVYAKIDDTYITADRCSRLPVLLLLLLLLLAAAAPKQGTPSLRQRASHPRPECQKMDHIEATLKILTYKGQ